MWRILRWVFLALAVLLVGLIALPFLLPTSVYKEQIIEQTRLATGRELKIDGDLKISIWSGLGVEVSKVSFANVDGGKEPLMATMDSMVVGAELLPLLSGSLKVTQLRLINPVIHLEIDKQGRGNWLFAPAEAAPAAAPTEGDRPAAQPQAAGDLSFSDVVLKGGVLTYRDARTGTAQRVEGIDVSVKLPSLDQPLKFAGALTWNKEPLKIDADIANPRALSTGGKSDLKATIESDVMNATFDGGIDAATSEVSGKVDFQTDSARRLAAWAGVALPKVRGFGPMKLSGALKSTPTRIEFNKAKLSLDGMNGSGNLALETARATPRVRGNFALDRLDLNPYMGSSTAAKSEVAAGGTRPWSDSAIDFSALKMVDADLDFAVDALSAGGLQIGRSALGIALSGGRLKANLKQLALYGGNGTGVISLSGAGATPQFALDLNFAGVQVEPFLTDAARFNRLTGTGNIGFRVAGSGRSQRAWMNSLGGTAQLKIEDGAIKGVNLAEIARTIQSALTGASVGGAAKTDFAELAGTFVIRGGVAANKDMKLLNPFVRLNGAGIIDLGNQTLNYRVEPKAVRSSEGQGGKGDLAGFGIPFRIKGPWSAPSYEPDLTGVIDSTLDSILKGKNPLDGLKDATGLSDLIPELGGKKKPQQEGAPPPNEPKKQPEKPNPLDELKGLFGGPR